MTACNREMYSNTSPTEWTALPGHLWVCGACGRYGKERDHVGDESCFLNAVMVKESRIVWDSEEGQSLRRLIVEVRDE